MNALKKKEVFLKEEGSIAIYVITTMFCFLAIIGGTLFASSTLRKNQLRTLLKIKETYNIQSKKTDKIIKERQKKDLSKYINDNLLIFFDGINNQGTYHSNSVNKWKNIKESNLYVDVKDTSKWRDNSLHFENNEISIKNVNISNNIYTLEVLFSISEYTSENIVFQTNKFILGVTENGKIYFYRKDLNKKYITTVGIELNRKYNIAVCSNEAEVMIFINGSAIDCISKNETIINNTTDIGKNLFGNIFSIRLYNKKLTEKEIKGNFNIDNQRYDLQEINKTIETISWEEINKIAKEISNDSNIDNRTASVEKLGSKLNVGDTKQVLYNGEYKKVRIIGFNHDELTDVNAYGTKTTTGKAGITFEFVDFLTEENLKQMRVDNTNDGGWASQKTTLKAFLEGTEGIEKLSNKAQIKQVKKSYIPTYNTDIKQISNDKLWLLSCSEIWSKGRSDTPSSKYGLSIGLEGEQYKWFLDNENAINVAQGNLSLVKKTNNKIATSWWLRSIPCNAATSFCNVDETGACTAVFATSKLSITPGFAV